MMIMIMTAAAMMTTMKITMMTITTRTTMITAMTMTLNNIFNVLHVSAIPRAHADAYADHSAERDLHGPQRLVGWQDVDDAGEADDVGHGEQPLGHVGGVPLPPVAAICSGTVGRSGHIIDDFRK